MSAYVRGIWRHPIKSHGREELARTLLSEGRCIPWDRRWALAHEMARIDWENPQWAPCANFSRGAKAPKLMAISARVDLRRQEVTLSHPELPELTFDPDTDPGALVQWVMPISAQNRALPARLIRAGKTGMTDTDYQSISLVNLASHADLAQRMGQNISPLRWRANLLLDGLDPWAERDWIGKTIRVGRAELEIREAITRCRAATASTRTGERDADTLGALEKTWGHREFGVYAVVTRTGDLRQGDPVEVLG